jgi:hypothetical protein
MFNFTRGDDMSEKWNETLFKAGVFLRGFLKRLLNAYGFSTCAHCGCGWNWVKGKYIPYGLGRAMFPVCMFCFKHLGTDKITQYAKGLVSSWNNPDSSWELIGTNVAMAVKYLKGELPSQPFESDFWES